MVIDARKQFGIRVKNFRERKGWTQEYLAETMDVSAKYISDIERGKKNPTLTVLIKLHESFGFNEWEMFDYSHEVDSKQLRDIIDDLLKDADQEQLRLIARILKAIIR